jgi:glycosyltransferase involved in cell wall biosynthesis
VGYNTPSGLGYLNRDLVTTGIADRWLVVTHPRLPTLDFPAAACEVDVAPPNITDRWIRRWLRGLDWVVCAELPCFRSLPELARTVGVRLALIPMWEAVSPSTEWIRLVDLLICPTRHSYGLFEDWKKRFGFTWSIRHIAWPVASDRFRFRQRGRCEQVVFINGGGGALARSVDGAPLCGRRKGADVVAEVARLTPEIPWIVYSQTDDVPSWPANVTVRPPPPDNADLYAAGDLCVQPSRWEGVGLPLIECQAAGIPLITTDAPPMNEHQPLCAIPPQRWDLGFVQEGQPVSIPVFDPQLWAQAVRERFGTDLSVASLAARQFVVQQRNWKTAAAAMRALFEPASRRGAN